MWQCANCDSENDVFTAYGDDLRCEECYAFNETVSGQYTQQCMSTCQTKYFSTKDGKKTC